MSWATNYIKQLQDGDTVIFRPRGNSMTPRIKSGDEVTVVPYDPTYELEIGNVVLCNVSGNDYLHLVNAIGQDGRVQIANNKGHINGWTKKIYGIVHSIK